MLGRLEMGIEEAIAHYSKLVVRVLAGRSGLSMDTILQKEFCEMIAAVTGNRDSLLSRTGVEHCSVYVPFHSAD